MEINWNQIETKWRAKWNESKDFETNPNEKPKKFITVAYPYPNSPQHIGHGRTYTLADVHARFYRMRGFNVLFPMGFHYTGTPVLGMAKRIQSQEKEILDGLRNIYHVPEEDIKTFVEPIKIADYFHQEIKSGMIEMGYSIDWRREFTTIVPGYQKFIEWQITTLKENGKIIQGSHPVGWCPRDQNPVSQHDTMGDVEPKIDDKNHLVKFKFEEYIFPVTTLRPETIFGITNLWVNPNTIYKKIKADDEKWIVSEECAKKIEFFGKEITIEGDIAGTEIIGKYATALHNNQEIPILEAEFVEPAIGTGLVMSVPAHAPKDYQALMDLKAKNHELASKIEPIPIISTEGYGEIPAKEICEKMGVSDQSDQKLEEATNELYLKEFTDGKLNDKCGDFQNEKVQFGRNKVRDWLMENKHLEKFPVLENAPVKCRCGTECVVKVLNNQWFLNYGDERDEIIKTFVNLQYKRNDQNFFRGTFRVRGENLEIFPSHLEDRAWRLTLFGNKLEKIEEFDPLTGDKTNHYGIIKLYANSHYITPKPTIDQAIKEIKKELEETLEKHKVDNKLLEAQRLRERTKFDLEMIEATGTCAGIENYSRFLSGRKRGEPQTC